MKNIPKIDDFTVVCLIGKGAFGTVSLVTKKSNGEKYALKTMSKNYLFRKNMAEQIIKERNILALSHCVFIVPLYYSIETNDEIHLVMEYMSGGDFSSLIQMFGFFCEETAKFYISEASLAIEYLHSSGIIHRDIKPANFLMSSSGHLKLSDFGLIKITVFRKPELSDFQIIKNENDLEVSTPIRHNIKTSHLLRTPGQAISLTSNLFGRSGANVEINLDSEEYSMSSLNNDGLHTLCPSQKNQSKIASRVNGIFGTPDYLAPEVILNQKYDSKVDCWSLGISLYEMVVGFPPFNDENVETIFDNIIKSEIEFPSGSESLSQDTIQAIQALLSKDPLERPEIMELKQLSFFKGIDWKELHKYPAPILPRSKKISCKL